MTAMTPSSLLVAIGSLLLAAGTGCASPHEGTIGQVASAQTVSTGAHLDLATTIDATSREAPLGEGGGVLVVGHDVFDNCMSVRHVRVNARDDKAWLALSKAIAHCVNDGELKARNIVLRGEARPQVVVKYMLTRLGVPETRIEMSDTAGLGSCVQDCDADDLRVEIGLSGSAKETTATTQSVASGM